MSTLLALVAPVALALPTAPDAARNPGPMSATPVAPETAAHSEAPREPLTQSEAVSAKREALEALYAPPIEYQVRIEQRVVIRVSPRTRAPRSSLMAEQTQRQPQRQIRYIEEPMDDCVSVDGISGVQPGSGNRLVLFMQDRRMVSARLDKSCRARDFYSGFYLERSEDGKLCVARDKLQSRAGANCELTKMRELVPIGQ